MHKRNDLAPAVVCVCVYAVWMYIYSGLFLRAELQIVLAELKMVLASVAIARSWPDLSFMNSSARGPFPRLLFEILIVNNLSQSSSRCIKTTAEGSFE